MRVVSLVSGTFPLSGNFFGTGTTRTLVPVTIPPNILFWCYTVSAVKSDHPIPTGVSLSKQVLSVISTFGTPSAAIGASVLSQVITPTGDAKCNVYLLDYYNSAAFNNKTVFTGEDFRYFTEASLTSVAQGKMLIDNRPFGQFYLGLRNTSDHNIKITVEVVAVVRELVNNRYAGAGPMTNGNLKHIAWPEASKNTLYQNFLRVHSSRNEIGIAARLAKCMQDKVMKEITAESYFGMAKDKQRALHIQTDKACRDEIFGKKTPEQERALSFGNLGWKAYENNELDKAIDYSKQAIKLDNSLAFAKANLGLFYLIKNEDLISLDFYLSAINDIKLIQDKTQAKQLLNELIEDLKKSQVKFPQTNIDESIALFQDELKQY